MPTSETNMMHFHTQPQHPKGEPQKPQNSPHVSAKSPSQSSCTRCTKQPRPTAPKLCRRNLHSILTSPCKPSLHGTERKRQAGWCYAPGGAYTFTSRRHVRATAELSALRELHTEVFRGENRTLERRAASAVELRENVVVCLPFLHFRISAAGNLIATPVSITQSLVLTSS